VNNPFGGFVAALRFLTIMPLPGSLGTGKEELAGAVPYFPLVGLLLGGAAVPVVVLLQSLLPPQVTAVLAVLLLLGFSGGLHLDGLADTADGFFSSRPREKILVIMRDSATGAMGVIALVMLLLLKAASLASLPSGLLLPAIFLMPLAGRVAIVLMMALLPYARTQGGLADLFYSRRSRLTGLWAFFFLVVVAWLTAGLRGLAAMGAVVLLVVLFAWFCRAKIAGATGDTLGASCELAEAVVALTFACSLPGSVA
jgi:adenosylcobinamide-GDP ribazoletransferase